MTGAEARTGERHDRDSVLFRCAVLQATEGAIDP
jgi:hypothetical protein